MNDIKGWEAITANPKPQYAINNQRNATYVRAVDMMEAGEIVWDVDLLDHLLDLQDQDCTCTLDQHCPVCSPGLYLELWIEKNE